MEEEKKPIRWRQVFQILALLLFLILLPGGSWYYLRNGLNYRIKALKELGDYGKIPEFDLVTYQGDTLRKTYLEGKLVVASFWQLPAGDAELNAAFGENLQKLHEQFDERKDVVFLQHILGDSTAGRYIDEFAAKYELTDKGQCFFLTGGQPSLEALAREGYRLPLKEGESVTQNPYLIFADTHLAIRHYYDVRRGEEVRRLVEHLAILLPREKEEEPELKREREK